MARKIKIILLAIIGLQLCSSYVYAVAKGESIDQAIYSTTVIPFEYKSQILNNGKYTNSYDNGELGPKMVQNRIMLSIKLVSNILSNNYNYYCELLWDKSKPDDVVLQKKFMGTGRLINKIELKNGSKTMLVDGKPVSLDVAPRIISGRTYLPLRGIAQATGKFIYWQDGLIFMSDNEIDFNSANLKTIISDTKKVLSQNIKIDYNTTIAALGIVNGENYLYKQTYNSKNNSYTRFLVKVGADKKEANIPLSVAPIEKGQIVDNNYYYAGKDRNGIYLYKYSISTKKLERLANFKDIQWDETFGWIEEIKLINPKLWIRVHFGDGIMGGESLFTVENGQFIRMAGAKDFGHWYIVGSQLYYSDINFMIDSGKIYRIDLNTKPYKAISIGDKDWVFDVIKKFDQDTKLTSMGVNLNGFFVEDDVMYVSGYKYDRDQQNQVSYICKISLSDSTTSVISTPISSFEKYKDNLYYISLEDKTLIKTDVNGEIKTVISDKPIYNMTRLNNYIYYTLSNTNATAPLLGIYCYDADNGKTVKVSNDIADSLYVKNGNVYYESNSYNRGIHKLR